VIVVDSGGSVCHAMLGDLLAEAAVEKNWSGLVINGCVRHVEILGTLPQKLNVKKYLLGNCTGIILLVSALTIEKSTLK